MLTVTINFVLSDVRKNHEKHENRPRRSQINIKVLYENDSQLVLFMTVQSDLGGSIWYLNIY